MGCERVLGRVAPDLGSHDGHEHVHLDPEPPSVRAARRWVVDRVQAAGLPRERVDVLALLVSELATNAVEHARTEMCVGLTPLPQGVLLTVSDQNRGHPSPRGYSDSAVDGRGLRLVDSLSTRWGVVADSEGKTVWCLVPRHLG
ncbi:MAG TPA: ATP-binding protein [Jiangellales bacterium]|nr:ATP-binding protein [Jiangellales bacterium]